jgi:hypothetical protein
MMNEQTKLYFAMEHILHLGDLFEGNEYQQYLEGHLASIRYEVERQTKLVEDRKGIRT